MYESPFRGCAPIAPHSSRPSWQPRAGGHGGCGCSHPSAYLKRTPTGEL